ncbi:MAG: fumarate hydratase [Candidatus Omnitrophica bacterium]|nr:fumarate hydratase [Candidatus Omnitrophota bacterium]
MRRITASWIRDLVAQLCLKANFTLRGDVITQLKSAYIREKGKRTKDILAAIMDNSAIARRENLAICQDTGMPCVFIEIGQEVIIKGDLKKAVNKGIEDGYKKGCLRSSVVRDPLLRGKPVYGPAVIHIDIVRGDKLKIIVLPKGFGCENKSRLRMFNPTIEINAIKEFIIETVKMAGPEACPPYIIGVGIGGTADYATFLAKKALLKKIANSPLRKLSNPIKKLEQELMAEINKLNIGPMGLGGKSTVIGVNIETYPTHIAGLPVAVNISCHALRSATGII